MKRNLVLGGMFAMIAVVAALILILHPLRARSDAAKATRAEVTVDNFSFTPTMLTVRRNTTVTWLNRDDVPHVIASSDGLFKSRALDTDDKYSYTFTKPGTYPYYCSVHPKMVGQVIVQ
ncbi:MAG TPA: cupredoxin family copper-binding protein [Silvibacterium sp.]|nr:cupredoxin family copper-binding protein [Silvibacterium sp.]